MAPGNEAGTPSTFVYSHSSSTTFGTVTQRDPAATVTTGAPFTFGQANLLDTSIAMPFANTVLHTSQASQMQFPAGPFGDNSSTLQSNYTNLTNSEDTAEPTINFPEPLLQLLSDKLDLNDEKLKSYMDENVPLAFLQSSDVGIDELTSLQDFNPDSFEIGDDGLNQQFQEIMESNAEECMVENINDSLSLHYSHSVELENEPST